jgi:hypothetical protein
MKTNIAVIIIKRNAELILKERLSMELREVKDHGTRECEILS